MQEVWVLYERNDFDHRSEWDYQNYRTQCHVFSSFAEAKKAMRRRICNLAQEKNSLFPNGKLETGEDSEPYWDLENIVNGILQNENYPDGNEDEQEIQDFLDEYGLSSEDDDFETAGFTNYLYGFGMTKKKEPELILHPYDDGPINGVNAYIYINCFVMKKPNKHYKFYVDNSFQVDQDFISSVFLDLEKKPIN